MRVLYFTIPFIVLDQLTKYVVKTRMDLYESIPVIQDLFHLTFVTNDGMAFGLNFPAGIYVFTTVTVLAVVGLSWYLWHSRDEVFLLRFSLALILAGAIGNLIDRVLYGEVVDFMDFMLSGHHWPVFNIADSSVTVGMFFFLYYSIILEPKLKVQTSVVEN